MECYHVVPENDLKEHIISADCECCPVVYVYDNGNKVISHNSYDGREHIEKLFENVSLN